MKFVLNLWGHRGDKSWPGGAVKELNIRVIESEVGGMVGGVLLQVQFVGRWGRTGQLDISVVQLKHENVLVVVKERVVRRGGCGRGEVGREGDLVLFAIIADSGTIHTSLFVPLCNKGQRKERFCMNHE